MFVSIEDIAGWPRRSKTLVATLPAVSHGFTGRRDWGHERYLRAAMASGGNFTDARADHGIISTINADRAPSMYPAIFYGMNSERSIIAR